MPTFSYIAIDRSGTKQSGSVNSESRAKAIRELEGKSLQVASINEGSKKKLKAGKSKASKTANEKVNDDSPVRLKNADLISFTEELSELLNAGLPLEPALASMEAHDDDSPIQRVAARLRRWITEGLSMYQVLPKVSPAFDPLYCNLVKAGEASGSLQTILTLHAEYLKEQADVRSRISQALIYPALLTLVCIASAAVFIFYLIPKITSLLDGLSDSEMPVGIKMANGISSLTTNYWPHGLIILGIIIIGIKLWSQSEKNLARWDQWKLSLPLYGRLLQFGFYVQWLQTVGNLMTNGVPLVKGLELTNETVQNRYYKAKLALVTEQVGDGYKLTNAMRRTEIFTPNLIDLIGVGESTGKLTRAFDRATQYYDKRLSNILKSFLSIISPLILVVMAVMAGLLCFTMVQAIYQSVGNIKQ